MTGDFDADGRIDVATANQDAAAVTVLSNVTPFRRAAYTFGTSTLTAGADLSKYRQGFSAGASLAAGDFNRDGKLDFSPASLTRTRWRSCCATRPP